MLCAAPSTATKPARRVPCSPGPEAPASELTLLPTLGGGGREVPSQMEPVMGLDWTTCLSLSATLPGRSNFPIITKSLVS